MGLFAHKDAAVKVDRAKPHAYQAPDLPPSSGRVACQVCGQAPADALHPSNKPAADEMRWS